MILIFDLDDTLYLEIKYVKSGFKAVALELEKSHEISREFAEDLMIKELYNYGRGKIFDQLLLKKNIFSKKLLKNCLNTYRKHKPKIQICDDVFNFLETNKNKKYLITDGNKNVQQKKIQALSIEKYFQRMFITHRYGIKNAKPSIFCFNKIKDIENCEWNEMVYIGDNPNKDFVSMNKVGGKTIRIHKGVYSKMKANKSFDAQMHINSFDELDSALASL